MSKTTKGWSEDFETKVREYYLSHRIGLRELARQSLSLFGEEFSFEHIKHYSQKGKWNLLKTGEASADDINAEVNSIRRVLYRQIVAMSEGGLMVVGESDELEALMEELDRRGFDTKLFSPTGLEPALVNSYMNLLSKANFDLGKAASKKTSQQRLLEIMREQPND